MRTFGGRVACGGSKYSSSASFRFARASSSVSPWLATSTSKHCETNQSPSRQTVAANGRFISFTLPHSDFAEPKDQLGSSENAVGRFPGRALFVQWGGRGSEDGSKSAGRNCARTDAKPAASQQEPVWRGCLPFIIPVSAHRPVREPDALFSCLGMWRKIHRITR